MSNQNRHANCAICDARVHPVEYRMRPGSDLWNVITLNNMNRAPFVPNSPICRKCYRQYRNMIGQNPLNNQAAANVVVQADPQENANVVPSSEARCCICYANNRCRIPPLVRSQCWNLNRIMIPIGNRLCTDHLTPEGLLDDVSLRQLANRAQNQMVSCRELSQYLSTSLHTSFRHVAEKLEVSNNHLNVLNSNSDCICYTSLNLNDFHDFCQKVEIEDMRPETKIQAIALLLSKLRMGNSQDQLGHFFGFSQSQVSRHIDAASRAADDYFVPLYLGYDHISRQQYLQFHQNSMIRILHEVSPGAVGVLLDGTYFEIEKSSNFDFQKTSFSLQKHYTLVKFMFVTAPDGYILDIFGPTGSDNMHNDASILNEMLADAEGFRNFFQADDILIVDRGFRDSLPACAELGLRVAMPPFLGKRKQMEREEADYGRFVTKVRWVIESVNGRMKNVFAFFRHQIANTYMNKVGRFLRIASALLNAYFCPIYPDRADQIQIAQFMIQRSREADDFHQHVLALGLDNFTNQYVSTDIDDIRNFPHMDEQDLRDMTVGIYSIGNAASYTSLHLKRNHYDVYDLTNYQIYTHRMFSGIILVRMESRYVRNKTYNSIVCYNPGMNGPQAIHGYLCSCQVGKRMVGMCCHIAAVLWLVTYARPNQCYRPPAEDIAAGIINLNV